MLEFMPPFSWTSYSKKLKEKIENPRSAGRFTKEEAAARQMRLGSGKVGELSKGSVVELFWLVDESDAKIVDAKFQVFGPSALVGAAEAASLFVVGKTYDQAGRLSAELIDKQLRDTPDCEAFPLEMRGVLNLVLEACESAAATCQDIPLQGYVSPVPRDIVDKELGGLPGYPMLAKAAKLALIEEVLNTEIRPYVELDAGGIEILDLLDTEELLIAYKGACTSCFSSIGTTLSTIQQILQAKVHPSIVVVPNMDDLALG